MAFSSVIKSRKIIDTGYLVIILALILSTAPLKGYAQDTLRLSIQPIQSEDRTREIFQPMADYIAFLTGKKVELHTYPNFLTFWSETQKGDKYDIVFDAAHFIDYRNKTHDYTVIAKQPGI